MVTHLLAAIIPRISILLLVIAPAEAVRTSSPRFLLLRLLLFSAAAASAAVIVDSAVVVASPSVSRRPLPLLIKVRITESWRSGKMAGVQGVVNLPTNEPG